MATKAELEIKIHDLQAVLSAVQDEREELKTALSDARGQNVKLERKLELAEDTTDELAAANVRIQELEDAAESDDRDGEIEQLLADKARLLSLAGLTETDFDLSAGSINAYLGKA